jgi:hypothetical protein
MPYANKADKAAQMRRYRARKRIERNARQNHPTNVLVQRSTPTMHTPQVQRSAKVESRPPSAPSVFDVLKQALSGSTPKPAVAAPQRYRSIAEIPPELLAAHGITRQGNALNAPAGVDVVGVLRILLK